MLPQHLKIIEIANSKKHLEYKCLWVLVFTPLTSLLDTHDCD